jgi:two-component system sensor histidine kinase/response regulator
VNARAFDLILMDIQMPVLDGVSATRAIRRLPDFAHIPIIALSANVLPGQIRQYEEDGFTAHVGKPINPKHLMSAIIACLDPPADAELKPRPQNGAEAKALV